MRSNDYYLRKMSGHDRTAVIDIFNFFIENGFAAYPEKKVSYDFFKFFQQMSKGLPAVVAVDRKNGDKVAGFGLMRPHSSLMAFSRTAELTYFISPEYAGTGIGRKMVDFFTREAKSLDVDCLLAGISSLNTDSIAFHEKMRFKRCGCLQRVGRKHGKDFDVIWMQKLL